MIVLIHDYKKGKVRYVLAKRIIFNKTGTKIELVN